MLGSLHFRIFHMEICCLEVCGSVFCAVFLCVGGINVPGSALKCGLRDINVLLCVCMCGSYATNMSPDPPYSLFAFDGIIELLRC